MDKSEALRSIRYDLVEHIQQKVRVDFDNVLQMPVSFIFAGALHEVDDVLVRFRTQSEQPINAYLMQMKNDEVYFLYFHFCDLHEQRTVHKGYWVLCFRILSDHELMALYREERKMLLNMHLKRVVDFHGHLCPDLVIGCKLCEYVQKLFPQAGELNSGISLIAENRTSSLDAIQIMLGTTVGNQRLYVMDFGKHNYTLLLKKAETGFRLSLKKQHFGDEEEYSELEQKIMNNQVVMEDMVQFQKLLDDRVRQLLGLVPEDIFSVKHVELIQPTFETASTFLQCSVCGEQVLKSRKIEYQDQTYCIPCFRKLTRSCTYHTVH
jgi:formylmethanofuran dehydrogenase subunit E